MDINFQFSSGIIEIISTVLAWTLIGFLAYRIYKKQSVKHKVGKVILVIFIGIFSFTINLNALQTFIKIPILPLGVWILYFILKGNKERWQAYRSFAWLGFFANFIFLGANLVTVPINHVIYPTNEPSTYISNVDSASIVNIHPSAQNRTLNTDTLMEQIHSLRQESIYSDQWYNDMYLGPDSNKKQERFPYLLSGAIPKWGSNLSAVIYIEEDGKGILLTTSNGQHYFRTNVSILEEGK